MRESLGSRAYDIRSVVRGVMHFKTYDDLEYVEAKLTELIDLCDQYWYQIREVENEQQREASVSLESPEGTA